MEGIRKGSVKVRIVCAVIGVRMTISARVNHLPGSQDGAAIFPFSIGRARRKLFIQIVR